MVQTGETIYGFQGQAYRIRERKGAGGEGTVYLTDQPGIVAKIYHNPTAVQERKLRCMLNKKIATKAPSGTSLIAWPKDILYQNGAFAGYTMPLIEAGKPIFTLYHDKSTREFFNDYNWTKSLCVAMNLAHLVDIIHNCDCVIGDMNPGNIIVHPNGLVSILDVDSFDITDPATGEHFKCGVGIPDYLAPELQHRRSLKDESSRFTKHTDEFSLAVHIFLLLFHYHPFLARSLKTYVQSSDVNQIDQNIANGVCPFVRPVNNVALPVGAPELSLLPPFLQEDFKRTFGYTALDSITKSAQRTSAKTWYEHLKALYGSLGTLMVPCGKNPEHYRRADQPCELCKAQARLDAWMTQQKGGAQNRQAANRQTAATNMAAKAPQPQPNPQPQPKPRKKSGGFYKFLLIAGILATLLGVWYAKESGSEQSRYERAVTLMNSGEYVEAIDIFEELADYEDSQDYLLLAKAGYVNEHLDREDTRTYWYLRELKDLSEGYREVYETLYQWRVEFLAVNTEADDETTNLSSASAQDKVYWHFKVTGGTPGAEADLYYQVFVTGEKAELDKFNEAYSNNSTGWIRAGFTLERSTTAYCRIYDENKELLGEKSIKIIK